MYKLLKQLADTEDIYLEPSALAGMIGPIKLHQSGMEYLQKHNLKEKLTNGTHIIWATGGNMVPSNIKEEYYKKGEL